MLSAIVAMDSNNLIGNNYTLPWNLKKDLAYFKEKTSNHTVIVGRKTIESIGRLLPNRKHIILTRNKDYVCPYGEASIVHSVEDLLPYLNFDEEIFVIGGADIYSSLLPFFETLYITKINGEFEGNIYFPKVDFSLYSKISSEENEENGISFSFDVYKLNSK